jgi:hypothetical protein
MSGFTGSENYGGNSSVGIGSAALGSQLEQLLMCDDISPGSDPSYQICKTIYLYHPLGGKLTETPIKLALSQARTISVALAPERVVQAFQDEWAALCCTQNIANVMITSRVYGVGSIVVGAKRGGKALPTDVPLKAEEIAKLPVYFNVLDPLNTSGSLVLNQNPNAADFQKPTEVVSNGQAYHPTRQFVVMNGAPIYIAYTSSAFGYVGRSVYQRILFPLKGFVQTMLTDDMVSQKAGVLIAKIKQPGSIVDRAMAVIQGLKRTLLKGARTYNVLSISPDEDIASLNLQNIDGASNSARDNILKNISMGSNTPSQILADEVFVQGFGEGTEDAKKIAHWVDGLREEMDLLFKFMDNIVMLRAWSEDFFKTMQEEHDYYKNMSYEQAFFQWRNTFEAKWPSLLTEPDSEKIKVDEIRLKSVIQAIEVIAPLLDPVNKAKIIEWAVATFNENEMLFESDFVLDSDALAEFLAQQQETMDAQGMGGPEMPGEGPMPARTGAEPPQQDKTKGTKSGPKKPAKKPKDDDDAVEDPQTDSPVKKAA